MSTTAYGQGKTRIQQIDSLVAAIDQMSLAVKGELQEFGPMKNGTHFYYDSTQNTLHKVVQSFGSEKGSMELAFYYSGHALQKCLFLTKEIGKEPFVGYIYYDGEKVLATNVKDVDFKVNHWRGQGFVDDFQKR